MAIAISSEMALAQSRPVKSDPLKSDPVKGDPIKIDAKGTLPKNKTPEKLTRPGDKNLPAKRPAAKMTKAREAAALAFVREHHGELEQLLSHLRENQPQQYDEAIRDLFRTSERLAGFQEKDAARYDLELKAWKLRSRIQLMSANLLMSPQDEELRAKVKEAIHEQLAVRGELLALERERTATHLQNLDGQIERLKSDADKMAQRQLEALLEGNKKRDVKVSKP
jgi:hypothetical protein